MRANKKIKNKGLGLGHDDMLSAMWNQMNVFTYCICVFLHFVLKISGIN